MIDLTSIHNVKELYFNSIGGTTNGGSSSDERRNNQKQSQSYKTVSTNNHQLLQQRASFDLNPQLVTKEAPSQQ